MKSEGERLYCNESERCSGLKKLLKRFNMTYVERKRGNTVVIEIKSKKPTAFPYQPQVNDQGVNNTKGQLAEPV